MIKPPLPLSYGSSIFPLSTNVERGIQGGEVKKVR